MEALRDVHTEEYLHQLHSSRFKVASVIELPALVLLPMCALQRMLLSKMRTHVAGTMLAAALAVKQGWAINIGGGGHHARFDNGVTPVLSSRAALLASVVSIAPPLCLERHRCADLSSEAVVHSHAARYTAAGQAVARRHASKTA